MRTRAAIVCVVVISLLVPVAVPALAGSPGQLRDAFTTKTPYRPQQPTSSYQRAPAGFAPVFTENVSRHGSRTLSDGDDADALLALWNIARSEDSLTTAGESLGAQVDRVRDTNAAIGYGLLTPDGVRELESTAARLVHRLPTLFRSVARQGDGTQIDVVASSQARTVQSANAFVAGLEAKDPALAGHVGTVHTDDDLLYFHKAAINKDYQDYVANDPSGCRGGDRPHATRRTHVRSQPMSCCAASPPGSSAVLRPATTRRNSATRSPPPRRSTTSTR